MDRAHDITNHFVTAFLLSELQDDAEATKALRPRTQVYQSQLREQPSRLLRGNRRGESNERSFLPSEQAHYHLEDGPVAAGKRASKPVMYGSLMRSRRHLPLTCSSIEERAID